MSQHLLYRRSFLIYWWQKYILWAYWNQMRSLSDSAAQSLG